MSGLDRLSPITLPALLERAALQSRFDRKYIVDNGVVEALIARLATSLVALEIDGRRRFRYESVYFDTRDLQLYRDHRQGRRRRWKARTRSYLDSGECMFEVKLKGRRDATVKERLPHPYAQRAELTADARAFLVRRLALHYATSAPRLEPVLSTRYQRATLSACAEAMRLTLDYGLCCESRSRRVGAPEGRVLVEVKSGGPDTVADRVLRSLGAREVSISKYCLAVALLDPTLPANRWSRVLRRTLGWERA
jgi:hypothetical protein